jgi:hypothetical protein
LIFPDGDIPQKDCDLLPIETANSQSPKVAHEPDILDRTAEYIGRIIDLKGRVKVLKRQIMIAMEQAEKSSALSKNVSLLEEQMSALKSKITRLEDGNLYMTEILEAASEQLICKSLGAPEYFCRYPVALP